MLKSAHFKALAWQEYPQGQDKPKPDLFDEGEE